MSARTEDAVVRVRALAARRISVDGLLEHIASSLGRELSPLTLMAVLKEAFGVPLPILRDGVEGWIGLGRPGCETATDEVAKVLHPYIYGNRVEEL